MVNQAVKREQFMVKQCAGAHTADQVHQFRDRSPVSVLPEMIAPKVLDDLPHWDVELQPSFDSHDLLHHVAHGLGDSMQCNLVELFEAPVVSQGDAHQVFGKTTVQKMVCDADLQLDFNSHDLLQHEQEGVVLDVPCVLDELSNNVMWDKEISDELFDGRSVPEVIWDEEMPTDHAGKEEFDELPYVDVIWDEEPIHELHIIDQAVLAEPVEEVNFREPLSKHDVDNVFEEVLLMNVKWDEMPENLDVHEGFAQQLDLSSEYMGKEHIQQDVQDMLDQHILLKNLTLGADALVDEDHKSVNLATSHQITESPLLEVADQKLEIVDSLSDPTVAVNHTAEHDDEVQPWARNAFSPGQIEQLHQIGIAVHKVTLELGINLPSDPSVRMQWDPSISTVTAWGQAVFRRSGNVMTQDRPKVVKPSIESQPSQSPSILYTRLGQQLRRASKKFRNQLGFIPPGRRSPLGGATPASRSPVCSAATPCTRAHVPVVAHRWPRALQAPPPPAPPIRHLRRRRRYRGRAEGSAAAAPARCGGGAARVRSLRGGRGRRRRRRGTPQHCVEALVRRREPYDDGRFWFRLPSVNEKKKSRRE